MVAADARAEHSSKIETPPRAAQPAAAGDGVVAPDPATNGHCNGDHGGNRRGQACHGDAAAKCHFHLAPPRHFLYPAILLLRGEEARHGYRLVDAILRFGFGPVDRPSIYRALSDLAHDGLLVSWEADSTAGSRRQVYALNDAGRAQLAEWMGVIALERDGLDRVLNRFGVWKGAPPDR
ncbi:hypothetical protein BH24ACT3_BH24ACT3_04020 [soil metagenome]